MSSDDHLETGYNHVVRASAVATIGETPDVGGKYHDVPGGKIMAGHVYVEYFIPKKRTHRFPLIMIAGGAMSGANFTGTADGRDGWAQYFVNQGYAVYLVDQVGAAARPTSSRCTARAGSTRPSS